MNYPLPEGTLTLPNTIRDRTVNMFTLGDSLPAPLSITVSRDDLLPDETFEAYLKRQIKLLSSNLKNYHLKSQDDAILGAGEHSIEGAMLNAHYMNGHKIIYQRQAAFLIAPERALIFTTTSQTRFSEQQDADWLAMLASFEPCSDR